MFIPRTLPSAALLVLVSTAGFAQTPVFSRTDYLTSDAPRGIATGDFNRDGAPDLALVNTGRKSVAILMNEKGEGFVQRYEIVLGGGPFDVVTGDVNHDSVLDLVVANADLNTIDVVLGRVSGGFEAPEHLAAAGFPRGVALADITVDGNQDIVYTQYDLDRVQILDGDGAGHFSARLAALPTGPRPQGIAIGPLTGCCRQDIAVANTTVRYVTPPTGDPVDLSQDRCRKSGRVERADDGGLQQRRPPGSRWGLHRLQHDGRLSGYRVGVCRLQFIPDRFLAARHRGRRSGPGRMGGLAVANRTSNTVSVYMARGATPGWFAPPVALAAGNGSRDVVSLDFNLDGHADLATANEFGDSASVFARVVAPSAGPFFEAHSLGAGNSPVVQVANFNGNQAPDLLGSYGVLLDGVTLVPLHSGGTASRSVMTAAAGDFNADGRMDAATVVFFNNAPYPQPPVRIELYYGNGAGGFQFAGAFGSFHWVYSFEAGDFNHDGRTDLSWGGRATSVPEVASTFFSPATVVTRSSRVRSSPGSPCRSRLPISIATARSISRRTRWCEFHSAVRWRWPGWLYGRRPAACVARPLLGACGGCQSRRRT